MKFGDLNVNRCTSLLWEIYWGKVLSSFQPERGVMVSLYTCIPDWLTHTHADTHSHTRSSYHNAVFSLTAVTSSLTHQLFCHHKRICLCPSLQIQHRTLSKEPLQLKLKSTTMATISGHYCAIASVGVLQLVIVFITSPSHLTFCLTLNFPRLNSPLPHPLAFSLLGASAQY